MSMCAATCSHFFSSHSAWLRMAGSAVSGCAGSMQASVSRVSSSSSSATTGYAPRAAAPRSSALISGLAAIPALISNSSPLRMRIE